MPRALLAFSGLLVIATAAVAQGQSYPRKDLSANDFWIERPQYVSARLNTSSANDPNSLLIYSGTLVLNTPIRGCEEKPHVCEGGFTRFELVFELPKAVRRGPQIWTSRGVPAIPVNPIGIFRQAAALATVASFGGGRWNGTWAVDGAWVDLEQIPTGDPDHPGATREALMFHALVAVAGPINKIDRIGFQANVSAKVIGGVQNPIASRN